MLVQLFSLKRSYVWLLSGVIATSISGQTLACDVVSGSAPVAPSIDYDVYGFNSAIGTTEFDLLNSGETDCELEIIIEDLASFSPPFDFPQAGVAIDVVAPGLQRPQDANNRNGIFSLIVPPTVTKTVQLDFFTDQTISVPSGMYSKDIIIGVRRKGQSEMLERYTTNLSLSSESQAQVNIAGAAGVFDKTSYMDAVDFGEAEIGESRRVYVKARSNAMATMTIRSENGGVMKHASSPDSSIAYGALLEGQTLDLSTPHIIPNLTSTTLEGTSRSLDLTIESMNQPFAGQYSDRIVIEIEAR